MNIKRFYLAGKYGIFIILVICLFWGCASEEYQYSTIPVIQNQVQEEGLVKFQGLDIGSDPDFTAVLNSGVNVPWLVQGAGIPISVVSIDSQESDKTGAYKLQITPVEILIESADKEGKLNALSTLMQLIQPAETSGYQLPPGVFEDAPVFEYRGFMLDIARNFFPAEDIKQIIPKLWALKMNYLHLHLSDDQGWRIEIPRYPLLAEVGGQTGVEGMSFGYLTQKDYREIQDLAAVFGITIVPEIDLPGHSNALLTAYPEFAPPMYEPRPYEGTEVGFSSLNFDHPGLEEFIGNILDELIRITDGPYIHIGGDEAHQSDVHKYKDFIRFAVSHVADTGKIPLGWEEIAEAGADVSYGVQYWRGHKTSHLLRQKPSIILSPASWTYLDMKYDYTTDLGLSWAGNISFEKAMDYDPLDKIPEILHSRVLGIEAPLWSETLRNMDDVYYMMFPRLFAYAEIGWNGKLSIPHSNFSILSNRILEQQFLFRDIKSGPF